MTTAAERSAVRSGGRQARRALRGADRARAEARLVVHLDSLAAIDAPSVGLFAAHDGEPDLRPLVERLWARGRVVALPVVADDDADRSMHFHVWPPHRELDVGRYGIAVPVGGDRIEPSTLLVSFTAFDRRGNRMGRGAGYFDRYLSRYSGAVVGVGFEAQRVDRVPMQPHDVALPAIVTDLGVRWSPPTDA